MSQLKNVSSAKKQKIAITDLALLVIILVAVLFGVLASITNIQVIGYVSALGIFISPIIALVVFLRFHKKNRPYTGVFLGNLSGALFVLIGILALSNERMYPTCFGFCGLFHGMSLLGYGFIFLVGMVVVRPSKKKKIANKSPEIDYSMMI